MDTVKKKNPSLLFLEVPVFSFGQLGKRPHEIFVNEGRVEDRQLCEASNYADSGGGHEIAILNTDMSRTLYWRTHADTLELFEICAHSNLVHSQYRITFLNSKVIPGVKVVDQGGKVYILFATLHAVHRLCLLSPNIRNKERSILHGLAASHFETANNNNTFHFSAPDSFSTFTAGLAGNSPKQATGSIFALGHHSGNISIVKMPFKGPAAHMQVNKASRMSRIWSGINPWAGTGVGDAPVCLAMVCLYSGNPKIVGVCRDNRIRVWSCKSLECVSQFDLRHHFEEATSQQEIFEHRISVLWNNANETWLVAVYCTSQSNPRVILLEANKPALSVEHVSTFPCLPDSTFSLTRLIDFRLQSISHLWALWVDSEDGMMVAVCDLETAVWHEVALSNPPPPEVIVSPHLSISEAFTRQIFDLDKFSPTAIVRALAMHRKSSASTRSTSFQMLKENVLNHIEQEASQFLMSIDEPNEDDYLEASHESWQKFYATCVEYHQFVTKPIGICTSSLNSLSIVKKNHVSHLVPISTLEAVCRGADNSLFQSIIPEEANFDDLGDLLATLTLLSSILGPEYFDSLHQTLQDFENPVEAVKDGLEYIQDMICNNYDLETSIARCGNIVSAAEKLLLCLEPNIFTDDLVSLSCSLFNGERGLEILSRAVERYVSDRLHLSLLFLIFSILDSELENSFPQRVSTFVQVFTALQWCVTEKVEHVSQSSIETTMQTLSMQDMSSASPEDSSTGLLQYFLKNEGGELVECILQKTCPEYDGTFNHQMVPYATAAVVQILWPLGPTLAFPDFLLSKSQFSRLHCYLEHKLISQSFCPELEKYMLAHCQLAFGKYHRAVRTFIQAGGNAGKADLLINQVLQIEDKDIYSQSELEIMYYTKVLQVFESRGLSEQCIQIARHAIQMAAGDDKSLAILCSSVFSHSMELGRHDEAYKAIVSNPDPTHRKDCLRAMVVTLCERREYKTLVEYPYWDMLENVVSILEHRARSTDILTSEHNYYDLLFSFHVHRMNYRQAGSVMYEQAWRFSVESHANSLPSLKQEHHCLVTAITCLQLVSADNQWLVHPVSERGKSEEGNFSPKRDSDGDVQPETSDRNVVLKELGDLKKEAYLVEMKLRLVERLKDNLSVLSPSMSPQDTLPLLNHNGLYDDAFELCDTFGLSKLPVFESLATRCVRASYDGNEYPKLSWMIRNNQPAALDHGHSTISDIAWRILKDYLELHEVASGGHRAVLKVLLGYRYSVPAWFLASYKKVNCPELLRMLICYDYLEEAYRIGMGYLDAVLGVGKEEFNIETTLSSIGGTTWVPYNELGNLILALGESNDQKHAELKQGLETKLYSYFEEIDKMSKMVEDRFRMSING